MERAFKLAKITKRVTPHGLRRTFNNLARQVTGDIVTRNITGHVTAAMTEHYSHVGLAYTAFPSACAPLAAPAAVLPVATTSALFEMKTRRGKRSIASFRQLPLDATSTSGSPV